MEHVRIELSVDFEKKHVSGNCSLRLKGIRSGLNHIDLDACDMEIEGVQFDGINKKISYDGSKLTVEGDLSDGKAHLVTVRYSSYPKDGIYFIGPDEKYPNKPVQAWTHSEAEFARYWFPCYDYPNDKFTSETMIRVPKGFVVISNGELVTKAETADGVTYHWKEDKPHPSYLTSFVAGKFGEIREESEGVPLYYYFPESRRDDVGRYFGETPRMVKVFNEVTGFRYPYSKYSQTTVEDFIFGGMENVDATTLATTRFHDAQSDEDFQVSYGSANRNAVSLVAHELAHQWFGDLVTCSDWAHAWLNEGFADYMQLLYSERTKGVDELRWDMSVNADDVFEEDEESYRRPIVERNVVYPDDLFDETLYKKGAWVLHELRYVVGDTSFFRGIREYLSRFAFRNADTDDFRKVMEEISGMSLQKFFEQGLYMAGYPEFSIAYQWDQRSMCATLLVRQVQKTDPTTPIFSLPADIVFYSNKGRIKKRVWLQGVEQTFAFELDSEPTVVEFDPEHWLFKKVEFKKTLGLLLNQLETSIDASSRADAAKALGQLRMNQSVDALARAATREQHWHPSACALLALGELRTPEALAAILGIGKIDNRRVRKALASALRNFKDERAEFLLEDLLRSDPSPYVRCEAALSLVKVAGPKALKPLMEAMEVPSPNDVIAEACLDAMGGLDGPEVRQLVLKLLPYGNPTRARIGAMKAIKGRGRILDEELPLLKDILLGDTEFSVREYIVEKLLPDLGERRLLDAVQQASRTDKDYRVRRSALEAYHRISSDVATSETISKLNQEVERLKEWAPRT